MIQILKAKIHRATVTDANLNYEGSISISDELIEASGIYPYEKVLVADVNNGQRFETYVIKVSVPNTICVNGAAAHLVNIGDKVIIMAYRYIEEGQAEGYMPTVVLVDDNNAIKCSDRI